MAGDVRHRLAMLADAAKYDASCASSGSRRARSATGPGNTEGMGICHSYTPDGRCVSLLKILLTNYCVYDCQYCVNRLSSAVERATFEPEEVVSLTLDSSYHSSAILRMEAARSAQAYEELVADLKLAHDIATGSLQARTS